ASGPRRSVPREIRCNRGRIRALQRGSARRRGVLGPVTPAGARQPITIRGGSTCSRPAPVTASQFGWRSRTSPACSGRSPRPSARLVGKSPITRALTFRARDEPHGQQIVEKIRGVRAVKVVNVSDRTFLMHLGGKIEVRGKMSVKTRDDLSVAYPPGVARVCMAIHHDPQKAYALTIKQNCVAVVTDGTAVLGLGDIGPFGAAPVMEGKALIFKEFAGVDAFPICLATKDVDEIVSIVKAISPIFGGINLEDISAPRCFDIETRLQKDLEIPVFHDDQ